MSASVQNNRWQVEPDQFAVRITVADVPGLFGKSLVVEPGTRALIVENGTLVGEVPPGQYTLQSFQDRLKFWSKKQTTAVLTRLEDVKLEFRLSQIPTQENLLLDVALTVAVQVADAESLLHNFMGARESVSVAQLRSALQPLVQRSVWDEIATLSITALTAPEAATRMAAAVDESLQGSFRRYGLNFVDIQALSVRHDKYDAHQRKVGEAWLIQQGIAHQAALDDLYTDNELRKIKKREQQHELRVLAAHMETDALESRLAARIDRIELQDRIRETLNSEQMKKLNSEEELRQFLLQIDEKRILRREERDDLLAGFAERQQDRAGARRHLLASLEIRRQQELDQLRQDIDYASRCKSLNHEIELAALVSTRENIAWQQELERSRQQAEHQSQLSRKQLEEQWQVVRNRNALERDESWLDLVHQQRLQQVASDVAVAQAERKRRVALIEQELQSRLETDQLELEKRRRAWELDVADRQSSSQLDRLARVNEINAQSAEREQRLSSELKDAAAQGEHDRELARIAAMSGLGSEVLIATARTENAALLADVKKQEAQSQADGHRQQLYERLTDVEKSKADAIATAYKEAMQAQQGNVQQMIQALGQIGTATATSATHAAPPPPPMAHLRWYVSVNGSQSGPYNDVQLRQQVLAGTLTVQTYVWRSGIDWTPAGQVAELVSEFERGSPRTPPPV